MNLSRDRRHSCWDSNRVCPNVDKCKALALQEPACACGRLVCGCVTRLPVQLRIRPLTWARKLTPFLRSTGYMVRHLSSQVDPVCQLSWLQAPPHELSSWPRFSDQLGTWPLVWAIKLTPSVRSAVRKALERTNWTLHGEWENPVQCFGMLTERGWGWGCCWGWNSRSRPMRRQGTPLLCPLHQSPVDSVRRWVAVHPVSSVRVGDALLAMTKVSPGTTAFSFTGDTIRILLHKLIYVTCSFLICAVVYNMLYPRATADFHVPWMKWTHEGVFLQ
jgi:hypothetical protein